MSSQPLKWHGGKHYLAKRIIGLMPPHLHYVEPYFGGGAVLFAKDPFDPRHVVKSAREGCSEVVNDIDGELMNFWRTLASPKWFPSFARVVQAVPFCEHFAVGAINGVWPEWEDGLHNLPRPVQDAVGFFIRYRQSRQGLGQDFATLSRNRTRRGMNEQASSWLSAVEGLPEAHERLKRVVILNDDALDVIRQQDGPKTFFYLDPPYLHETRVTTGEYQHEMDYDAHENLLHCLSLIKGKFILSGYPSALYDKIAYEESWHRVDISIDCKASGAETKPKRIESLWMNYTPTPDTGD